MEPAFYRGDLLFLYHDRRVRKLIHFFVFGDTSGKNNLFYSSTELKGCQIDALHNLNILGTS